MNSINGIHNYFRLTNYKSHACQFSFNSISISLPQQKKLCICVSLLLCAQSLKNLWMNFHDILVGIGIRIRQSVLFGVVLGLDPDVSFKFSVTAGGSTPTNLLSKSTKSILIKNEIQHESTMSTKTAHNTCQIPRNSRD